MKKVDGLNKDAPKGAQIYIDGIFYKVGIHDFVFVYLGSSWMKSSHSKAELYALMDKDEAKKKQEVKIKTKRTEYNREYKQKQERKRKDSKHKKRKEILKRKNNVRGRT